MNSIADCTLPGHKRFVKRKYKWTLFLWEGKICTCCPILCHSSISLTPHCYTVQVPCGYWHCQRGTAVLKKLKGRQGQNPSVTATACFQGYGAMYETHLQQVPKLVRDGSHVGEAAVDLGLRLLTPKALLKQLGTVTLHRSINPVATENQSSMSAEASLVTVAGLSTKRCRLSMKQVKLAKLSASAV